MTTSASAATSPAATPPHSLSAKTPPPVGIDDPPRSGAGFGPHLRWWRTQRRYSQLQLAHTAEVSSRHLSFLETGKSKPSREMVVHLALALDLSRRDQNALLHEAGFAPAFPHVEADGPEMNDVRTVLATILAAHMPNPAVVVDRSGDLIDANHSGMMLLAALVSPDSLSLAPTPNVNRVVLHPDGVRSRVHNWDEVAASVLSRLERERAHRPADQRLADVLAEVLDYPGMHELRAIPRLPTGADLLVHLRARCLDGVEIALISTISTIGAPYDVTLDELHLETFFPADPATAQVLEAWGSSAV